MLYTGAPGQITFWYLVFEVFICFNFFERDLAFDFLKTYEPAAALSIENTVHWIIIGYVLFHFVNLVTIILDKKLTKDANSLRIVLLSTQFISNIVLTLWSFGTIHDYEVVLKTIAASNPTL